MPTGIHACTHTHTCTCACMHTCTQPHAQASTHTHTHTHTKLTNNSNLFLHSAGRSMELQEEGWGNLHVKLAVLVESINGHLIQEFCLAQSRNKGKQTCTQTCFMCWKHQWPPHSGIKFGTIKKQRETDLYSNLLYVRKASMATSSRNSVWHNQETKGNRLVLKPALCAESIDGHLIQEFCLAQSRNKGKQTCTQTCFMCWKHQWPPHSGIKFGTLKKQREM